MAMRRFCHSCVLFHKIILNKRPKYLFKKIRFQREVNKRSTRHASLIYPPKHKTALFKRGFTFTIYKIYNKLPDELKKLNISSFKKRIKQLLFSENLLI